MTIQEIKQAVNSGKKVYQGDKSYEVIKDHKDQWFIKCNINNHMIGLTWADNKTLNAKENTFFTI